MIRTIWGLLLAAAILGGLIWWIALYREKPDQRSWFGMRGGEVTAVG